MTGKIRAVDYPSVTRTTYRDYTHVVIALDARSNVWDKSFCGREELAQKREKEFINYYQRSSYYEGKGMRVVVSEVENY